MVEISEDILSIKEVDLSWGQFREAAAVRCLQDVRQGQMCHSGISSMDFQHITKQDAVQRYTVHCSDLHFVAKI